MNEAVAMDLRGKLLAVRQLKNQLRTMIKEANGMCASKKKRALLIVGAGASVEYGIPATVELTRLIESAMQADEYCVRTGGSDAFNVVKTMLENYYDPHHAEAHFERIYHVIHELAALHVTPGAVPKYKPVLYPFLSKPLDIQTSALNAASAGMLKAIYEIISTGCATPKTPLDSLTTFLQTLGETYTTRIYTTNYDDFFGQAAPSLFTGFTRNAGSYCLFNPRDYWEKWDEPSLFHLHGSVHLGFPHGAGVDIGDLAWFDSRKDALQHAGFNGSDQLRADGTGLARSSILTGLDKLGRMQQSPYAFYYAGLSKDLADADIIIVIGSGLTDLHINMWISSFRRQHPNVPLLFVSHWHSDKQFYEEVTNSPSDREISIFHDLRIALYNLNPAEFFAREGWTIDRQSNAAVWSNGFQSFLNSPNTLCDVLREINA